MAYRKSGHYDTMSPQRDKIVGKYTCAIPKVYQKGHVNVFKYAELVSLFIPCFFVQ